MTAGRLDHGHTSHRSALSCDGASRGRGVPCVKQPQPLNGGHISGQLQPGESPESREIRLWARLGGILSTAALLCTVCDGFGVTAWVSGLLRAWLTGL